MSRICEMCPEKAPRRATVYCPADACYLCARCDHEVHSANRLARRHVRRQLVADDISDGSSINDESDARVPHLSSSSTTISPVTPNKQTQQNQQLLKIPSNASYSNLKQQIPQNSIDVDDSSAQLPSLNDVSVTFEDAAEYDFCFETLAPQMVPLVGDEESNLFADGKLAKSFYPDLSWDSVVTDAFDQVVADENMSSSFSPSPMSSPSTSSKKIQTANTKSSDTSKTKCSARVSSTNPSVKKEESIEMDLDLIDCEDHDHDSMDMLNTEEEAGVDVSASPFMSRTVTVKKERKLPPSVSSSSNSTSVTREDDLKADKQQKIKLQFTQSSVKKSYEVNGEKIGGSSKFSAITTQTSTESVNSAEDDAKLTEQRKKRRMEALARFRSKRANRSFTKKVRYECRKQLADSRPRVKGRFVRKVEMALFHKYGAMYREHLDELKVEQEKEQDQRIPTM